MKASVSALALAICLAACTTASADTSAETASAAPAAAPVAADRAAPTADEARAFVAQAEKELGDFSLINNRAQWVNNTHITDDTDAIAAYFGTIGTEMSVKYAAGAARFNDVAGLD